MNDATAERLVGINRTFYARFFAAFDETRARPWPGWRRLLDMTTPQRVVDLACGNGRFADYLAQQIAVGDAPIDYEGWDDNTGLLKRAQGRPRPETIRARFRAVDLLAGPWPTAEADLIVAFGIMHHIPGFERRAQWLARAWAMVADRGHLAVTFWRFAPESEPRVAIAPWRSVAIDPDDVDAGDYLVRWRRGGDGLRYCHHADPDEIERLVSPLGGTRVADYASDGASGDMNAYVVIQKAPPPP